jgi:hypothetical protein
MFGKRKQASQLKKETVSIQSFGLRRVDSSITVYQILRSKKSKLFSRLFERRALFYTQGVEQLLTLVSLEWPAII